MGVPEYVERSAAEVDEEEKAVKDRWVWVNTGIETSSLKRCRLVAQQLGYCQIGSLARAGRPCFFGIMSPSPVDHACATVSGLRAWRDESFSDSLAAPCTVESMLKRQRFAGFRVLLVGPRGGWADRFLGGSRSPDDLDALAARAAFWAQLSCSSPQRGVWSCH